MSKKENGTKSATVNSVTSNGVEEVPSSSNNQVKSPTVGLKVGKRPTRVPHEPPIEIEAESSCDTAVSAAECMGKSITTSHRFCQDTGISDLTFSK